MRLTLAKPAFLVETIISATSKENVAQHYKTESCVRPRQRE